MKETTIRVLQCVLTVGVVLSASVPPVYDQRQEGQTNVHAQLENVVLLLVPPAGTGLMNLVDFAAKSVGFGGPTSKRTTDSSKVEPTSDDIVDNRRTIPLTDDRLQRDPDYSQVQNDKIYGSLPHLSFVAADDEKASTTLVDDLQLSTSTDPSTVLSSSSSSSSSSSVSEIVEPTPLVVKDAVTAHSPKLALYSQFRSASSPHHKKQNRRSR